MKDDEQQGHKSRGFFVHPDVCHGSLCWDGAKDEHQAITPPSYAAR
jgi:hypothetical protein